MKFLCPSCRVELQHVDTSLRCESCGTEHAICNDGMAEFHGCLDKESFFEKQAIERLGNFYADYSPERFQQVLEQKYLWQMDWANKRVGISRKKWWEPHIGKIRGKRVMEIGCGVNYIVPYFLSEGNKVFAFDICKESVLFLKNIIKSVGIDDKNLEFAVADATTVALGEKFDVVNINNVAHHIEDKPAVFRMVHDCLKDDGKLIMVEPNYYYPPRWICETDALDPINFVKEYFVRNDLLEKGEKAIVFSTMVEQLIEAGFKIERHFKDDNYLGYFTVYWMKNPSWLSKLIFNIDKYILRHIIPMEMAPFQYIVASKA